MWIFGRVVVAVLLALKICLSLAVAQGTAPQQPSTSVQSQPPQIQVTVPGQVIIKPEQPQSFVQIWGPVILGVATLLAAGVGGFVALRNSNNEIRVSQERWEKEFESKLKDDLQKIQTEYKDTRL
jgi:hypothetical protein